MEAKVTAEGKRLADSCARKADWKNFGPYLSDRAWGTVREDYSHDGAAWTFFPHDHARSRAYRWNEDGIGGVCNRFQNFCLSAAFWNEKDSILKERLFGLNGQEGNHGEDCKEYYFYLDSTPSHSYMKMLYKYPQVEYPYANLVQENQRRGKHDPEYELIDALRQPFYEGRYFDIFIEYAKAGEEDLLCRITAFNRGPDPAPLHILPHFWFRNTWDWGYNSSIPEIHESGKEKAEAFHRHLGTRFFYVRGEEGGKQGKVPQKDGNGKNGKNGKDGKKVEAELLFTENETNYERLFSAGNKGPYVKDGINEAVVNGDLSKVNPEKKGTKMAAHVQKVLAPGESLIVEYRFTKDQLKDPFGDFNRLFDLRKSEADEFYETFRVPGMTDEEAMIQRQAFAGLMWTKQFYHLSIELWLKGDKTTPTPPASRLEGRNSDWKHLYCNDVISMPDKWEYPWFAAWDLCFHCIPIAMIDPELAKRQLTLVLREWYMHPNGQIPAYEWAFGDVNPPVHAYATYRVYKIEEELTGKGDIGFLERIFHKLLLNFTWWVNRKDQFGKNVFQGGFLGLDNIGVFDRSAPLPNGGTLEQSDGTAWMGMYSLNMLRIALEIAAHNPSYEDVATKFFEHFIYIANAMYTKSNGVSLWDQEDGFFYDLLRNPAQGLHEPIKLRSFVGLISLFAVTTVRKKTLEGLPNFVRRLKWFVEYRPDLVVHLPELIKRNADGDVMFAIVSEERLKRILTKMLDEDEFLSNYGLRALSRYHKEHPFVYQTNVVGYEPAESRSGLFGGNSNWRGPIWFPVNCLMIDALMVHFKYYGDDFKVELPSGSGKHASLKEVARELSMRMLRTFTQDQKNGNRRAFNGNEKLFQEDPHWKDYILFYEYFHGCEGTGLGASHQTGWTALIAKVIQEIHTILK